MTDKFLPGQSPFRQPDMQPVTESSTRAVELVGISPDQAINSKQYLR